MTALLIWFAVPAMVCVRYSHIAKDFTPESDLLIWMKSHSQPSAASYVNWIGRTVRQIQ